MPRKLSCLLYTTCRYPKSGADPLTSLLSQEACRLPFDSRTLVNMRSFSTASSRTFEFNELTGAKTPPTFAQAENCSTKDQQTAGMS